MGKVITKREDAFKVQTAWEGAVGPAMDAAQLVEKNGGINVIVEIGIDFGFSLFHFADRFPKALVFGVDSYDTAHPSRIKFESFLPHFPNARFINRFSKDAAWFWKQPVNYLTIDILHIDADHTYENVKDDYECWHKFVRTGGAIMFHDIHSNQNSVGRFFRELQGRKEEYGAGGPGLGILWVD